MQLYHRRGQHEVWHGDCREMLPEVEAGLILADPPWGIGYESRHNVGYRNSDSPFAKYRRPVRSPVFRSPAATIPVLADLGQEARSKRQRC